MRDRNLLVRTRGGAVKAQMVAFDRPVAETGTINVELKDKIGRAAAELVSAGETVMLDAGSTTLQVARHLDVPGITVVTNSFDVALTAMSKADVDVMMIGGMARRHGGATVGPTAEEQVRLFRADTAILGMNGVSPVEGLTTPNLLVAQVKRAMIQQSRRTIVVADHTKLSVVALCKVAPMEVVSILVTDDQADEEVLAEIRAEGPEVVIAR